MGLFGSNKKDLSPLLAAADFEILPEVGNYESTLNYLIGLSDEEYTKVTKVAGVHRKAYQESAGILGDPNDATTFINPPSNTELVPSDVNHIEPQYLEDEPKTTKKAGKQIKVKD